MKATFPTLAALTALVLAAPLGGCNQKTLFKPDDAVSERRVGYFSAYDGETAKAAAERRKQQADWGFGPPSLMGGGQ